MSDKILISPGFGAGWSTWFTGTEEEEKFMLTYPPLVEAIEKGERERIPELVDQLKKEMEEKFGTTYFYEGGASNLEVTSVYGPFRIEEYDGSESLTTPSDLRTL